MLSTNNAIGVKLSCPAPGLNPWQTVPDGIGQPCQVTNVAFPIGDAMSVTDGSPTAGPHDVDVPFATDVPDVHHVGLLLNEIEPEPEIVGVMKTWPANAGGTRPSTSANAESTAAGTSHLRRRPVS
ncbi:hypothetical protein GCM10009795_014630 [Nocardioides hankookensis]